MVVRTRSRKRRCDSGLDVQTGARGLVVGWNVMLGGLWLISLLLLAVLIAGVVLLVQGANGIGGVDAGDALLGGVGEVAG